MEEPKFLYHYTTIKSLAYILASRKIKFSPLTNVDDKQEGGGPECEDLLSQYIYVSCWTDISEEDIPIWSMYANQMTGVRIKLPTRMFYEYSKIPTKSMYTPVLGKLENNDDKIYIISNNDLKKQFYTAISLGKDYLIPIVYEQINLSIPSISQVDGGFLSYFVYKKLLKQLGTFKNPKWKFQSEWRFKIVISPYYKLGMEMIGDFLPMINTIKDVGNTPDIYAEIKNDAFQQMEVLLGPRTDNADRYIVESLLQKYNPTALPKFKKSVLEIR